MGETFSWMAVEQELQKYSYPDETQEVVIFGAGFRGQLVAPLLREEGLRLTAFCDNDETMWTKETAGLPCISPQTLRICDNPFVLISAIEHSAAIGKQLLELGIPYNTVDAYVIWKHRSSFYEVYRMLDTESRHIFAGLLLCRMQGNPEGTRALCSDAQYFALPEFRFCGPKEIFVDCGAFTGENSQTFINNVYGSFQRIYAFEGNPKAIEAMGRRFAHEKSHWLFKENQIVCERRFVTAQTGLRVPFHIPEDSPANSYLLPECEDGDMVETVSLDQYFHQCGEERITFLKADIEGAEWDMLHGAAQVIQHSRPKIATSIYHNIYDFFRIPLLLREWVPDYHFAVRHHWYSFSETVLYCYVSSETSQLL